MVTRENLRGRTQSHSSMPANIHTVGMPMGRRASLQLQRRPRDGSPAMTDAHRCTDVPRPRSRGLWTPRYMRVRAIHTPQPSAAR